MSYKSVDGLMRHLRNDCGIAIQGSTQKRQLRNMGYFHGYKGYRFYKTAAKRIPYQSFDEVNQTFVYDSALKSLIYEKIMFIETAVKNRALESIMEKAGSEDLSVIFDEVLSSYKNSSDELSKEERKKIQQDKLDFQKNVQNTIFVAYRNNNPQITHFYMDLDRQSLPVWAVFEVITMGSFGKMLKCLTYEVRDDISRRLNMRTSMDTNREFVYKYIWLLKDLRNAVAHNSVIFDTRFRRFTPKAVLQKHLAQEVGLPFVKFDSIGDYIILITFFLKMLGVTKTELKAFVRSFLQITANYEKDVNPKVAHLTIQHRVRERMAILETFIQK